MNRETFVNGNKTILNTDFYIYLLKCENNQNKLISFLEDKIYRQELLLEDWKMDTYNYNYQKGIQFAYKNVLDFIKEGGKE